MSSWLEKPLSEIANIVMGQSPDSRFCTDEEQGMPFIQGCAEFSSRHPDPSINCSQAKKIAKAGAILFSVRAPVGKINVADQDYVIGRGLAAISATNIDASLLEKSLVLLEPEFRAASQGSTFEAINSKELSKWPIRFPGAALEQAKIAEVLSTLDRAIEQTEALIAKQQRIKTGLMQDLLTRGIDEHGNIRSEATHAFKDSLLGRIPVEWDVAELSSLLADVEPAMRSGPFGSALLKEELTDSGVPLLGIDNVLPGKFVSEFTRFVPPKKAKKLGRYRVRPRDLMVTIMGTVGRCCMVPDEIGRALSSKHVWTLSLDEEKYSPYVACLQINHSPWVLEHFAKDEQGGIMASIRADTLRTAKLPLPPRDELTRIEKVLRGTSEDIVRGEACIAKLRSLKAGLMHDLLTGKRRVTALLEKDAAN